MPALLFILGLLTVIGAAELIVRGSSQLAARMGISPMVVGVTVVAMGTSAPELAIGIGAALKGSGALALGNIAGTNTLNILFILGLVALVRPVVLRSQTIRLDLPVMVGAAALLLVFALDGVVNRVDGAVLIAAGLVYSAIVVRAARRESIATRLEFSREFAAPKEGPATRGAAVRSTIWLLGGLAAIVVGSDLLVNGATEIARSAGVSEAFIGLTIVAIGTSAPELVTAIVASLRREPDIAVGNLLGSSIYNILFIFGVTALVPADGIAVEPVLMTIDLPVMLAATVACIPVFLTTGKRIRRFDGALFVAAYLVYLAVLLLTRT